MRWLVLVTGRPAMKGAAAGSEARHLIAGLARLSARAVPTNVPPVPTAATKWVTRPSLWRQISGPVVASWAAAALGVGDDPVGDPILDAAARRVELELERDPPRQPLGQAVERDQRRLADRAQRGFMHWPGSDACGWPRPGPSSGPAGPRSVG